MSINVSKKIMMFAITLLDKQEGMPILEWNMLKELLIAENAFDSRDIIMNITIVGDRVILDEEWVENNYHRFE